MLMQYVVGLVDLGDGIGELTAAPVLEAVHFAAFGFDHRAVTLDHRGDLFTLVRVDQKHDFIVSQAKLLMDYRLPVKAVEQGLPAGHDGRARIMPYARSRLANSWAYVHPSPDGGRITIINPSG